MAKVRLSEAMERQRDTLARVEEIIEALGTIGANDMGDFNIAEAWFFHAAYDMLVKWHDTVVEGNE